MKICKWYWLLPPMVIIKDEAAPVQQVASSKSKGKAPIGFDF